MTAGVQALWKRLPIGSGTRSVVLAGATVGALTVLVKAISMVKESVVAAAYGTTSSYDASVIALLVPTTLTSLISLSLNSALIPTYIEVRDHEGDEAAERLYTSVLCFNVVLLLLISALSILTISLWLPSLASGYDATKISLTTKLVICSMPLVAITGLSTTWGAVLNAHERFGIVAISPSLNPILLIVTIAFLSRSLGIYALVLGTVFGAAMEAAVIGWTLRCRGHALVPKWWGLTPHVRTVLGQYGATVAAAMTVSSMTLVDQGMAASLGPGSNASLSYGMKLPGLLLGFAATAVGTAVLPQFSRVAAKAEWARLRAMVIRYSSALGLAGLIVALGCAFCSPWLVKVFYERGAFTSQDVGPVAGVQFYYFLRLPISLAAICMVRALTAIRYNQALVMIGVGQAIVNAVLDYMLMRRLGVAGIAAASLGVSAAAFIVAAVVLLGKLGRATRRSESI